jgi:four helix bundle protein
MLRIYSVALEVAKDAAAIADAIGRRDSDLARQLRRAVCSVALNIAEGSGSAGGNRRSRYATALGSARETRACFDVGVAMGYIGVPDAAVMERLGQVIGTLTRVAK